MIQYPFNQDIKFKIFKIMREIINRASEFGQFIFSPFDGENEIVEVAVKLLAEHGIIAYQWNPDDPQQKGVPMIGKVLVVFTVAQYLQIFDNEKLSTPLGEKGST
jgi:hypothetical protein